MKDLQIERPERYLVRALLDKWDDAEAAVIGDWCEERGFSSVAEALRAGPTEESWRQLNALAICLGLHSDALEVPRTRIWAEAALETSGIVQDSFIGLPDVLLQPHEVEIVETSCVAPTRIQRLMFDRACIDAIRVHQIRFGAWNMLMNVDPVPARLIDGNDPSVVNFGGRALQPNEPISLTLENTTDAPIRLSAGFRCQVLIG